LLVSRGEDQFPTAQRQRLGNWTESRIVAGDREMTRYDDAGLLPLVTGNLLSSNRVHREFARTMVVVLRRMPTLRNNLGALTTLLATGLGLQLLLSVVASLRRSLIAEATSEVASTLRRQIHRQMYRQGHSSLPTEGVGPVVNLFTREVNDVRLGLFNELDLWYRIPLYVGGLLLFSLGIAWLPTIFLASLGGLVWLSTRAMNRAFRQASGTATRDAAV
jgi:ATP-binding cassette, subfamily B, bacterial